MRVAIAVVMCAACYDEPSPPLFHNLVFVTAQMMPANSITGLDAADAVCNSAAAAAHLPGHYVAWLSTSTVTAASRLGTARGWARVDGKPFADRVSDILAGRMLYPPRLDENGHDVIVTTNGEQTPVATGTLSDGTNGDNCRNFGGGSTIVTGVPDATAMDWTELETDTSCEAAVRLYCFGIDVDGEVEVDTSTSGKLAFVSEQYFTPGGGLASADQQCQADADAAGFSGTFAALLATKGVTAASRFTVTPGQPWIRPDHVVVTADLENLQAPLDVTAALQTNNDYVLTGANDPHQPGDDSCADWTSAASSGGTEAGFADRSDEHAFSQTSDYGCDSDAFIYCFER